MQRVAIVEPRIANFKKFQRLVEIHSGRSVSECSSSRGRTPRRRCTTRARRTLFPGGTDSGKKITAVRECGPRSHQQKRAAGAKNRCSQKIESNVRDPSKPRISQETAGVQLNKLKNARSLRYAGVIRQSC